MSSEVFPSKQSLADRVNPSFFPEHQRSLYKRLEDKHTLVEVENDPLGTKMVINLGPQHPATHGVLRVALEVDGETIIKAVSDVGYLHRGIEKIAENKTYQEFMPYTDRMDYMSPYSNNVGYCLAIEKLVGIEVPERAQYIRTIACELARISAHLLWLGTMVMDAGAVSMFIWTFREREHLYSIFDKLAGVRFTVSHCRIGGIAFDVSDEVLNDIREWNKNFRKELAGWRKLLANNGIWLNRNRGVGVITKEQAIDMGVTGPVLRASGVPHDIRTFEPYLVYDRLDFDVVIREEGDSLARYYVRLDEMEQSVRMLDQLLDQLPGGDIRADNAKWTYASKDEVYYSMEGMIHDFMMTDVGVMPPAGAEVYQAIEAPKGELGYHIKSDGTGSPWRIKINAPSFSNLQILESMMQGAMIADTVVLIGSLDPVMGECDK
ncbi:NADH dehydrogenase (quinone) subunit D [Pontibacter sp. G13]|uniref:NADH dehydrogenase (quinone) subunit D n=1 Tax=Pontibacter sp. G13 TaxID=3074898 RepID=UPI00288AA549|nr:NADH dehydrogenase (quinone) subunit D [Pontibacter sp. G13]WNJ18040.1 NADH dehydrogenase (quinone) subunit D [Pontibacter sp. G13]